MEWLNKLRIRWKARRLLKASGEQKNLHHSGAKLAKNFLSLLLARVNTNKGKGVEKDGC
jgi:hypothetical protein